MSIGTTIKKLRRERNMTQEQLAELLGLSTNAVSQWECDKTAPDISNIPMLASIFEVSADVLLEIDIAKNKKQAEIKTFIETYQLLHSQGKTAERLTLCRGMQKKYPNDETVLYLLMQTLQNGYPTECFDEIVMLGERLLTAQSMAHRTGAIRGLCFTYLAKGDRQKAKEYADMMPINQDLYLHVLEGDELAEHCRNYFWKACDKMYLYMQYHLNCEASGYTPAERHEARKMLYDMFHMIFRDGDLGFWHGRLARISFFMACDSMRVGEHDRALCELEQMIGHLEGLQSFTSLTHTSLLVRGLETHQAYMSRSHEETLAQSYLRYLNNQTELFAPVSEDARFVDVKQKMSSM